MELLKAVRDYGSIKLAAKAMKMFYRHAWEIINDMNEISERPVVDKNAGGTWGEGSFITKEGEILNHK